MKSPFEWLELLAEAIIYDLLNLEEGARLAEAILYFIPGFILLLFLLTVVLYIMATITRYLSFEKIRRYWNEISGPERVIFLHLFSARLRHSVPVLPFRYL